MRLDTIGVYERVPKALTFVQYGGIFTTKSVLSGGFFASSSRVECLLQKKKVVRATFLVKFYVDCAKSTNFGRHFD